MKKRVVPLFFAVMFLMLGIIADDGKAYAQDSAEDVAISEVWTEDALIGYAESQTWGVYLARGISVINDAGGGKIGCGGITEAALKCRVSVNVVVEKKVNGSWVRVTSWSCTNACAYSATVSKYLSVGSGYYYRVRSSHSAASDSSSSYTGALWM